MLGHLVKECNDNTNDSDSDEEANWTYGPWMRASPFKNRSQASSMDSYGGKTKKMLFKPTNRHDQGCSLTVVQHHHDGRKEGEVVGRTLAEKGNLKELMARADSAVSMKTVTEILNGSFDTKLTLDHTKADTKSKEQITKEVIIINEEKASEEREDMKTVSADSCGSIGVASENPGVKEEFGPLVDQAHHTTSKKWTRLKREARNTNSSGPY
ncbi:uncharacterized protein G2W53_013604 [Senna tora]|uniref:Uncharacterized protein n=1 Tax=Senna tora TaxID=362788 RepID=A0A834U1Y5_9FABA|nr:uncharacterized protein G2W53_013604 [Senna tora]